MKVKVLQLFVDKYNHITRYEPGTVHEFDDERAMDLVKRGLAEAEAESQEPGTKNQDEDAVEKNEAVETVIEVAPEVVAEVKEVAEVEAEAEVAPEVVAEAEVAPEVETPKKAKK